MGKRSRRRWRAAWARPGFVGVALVLGAGLANAACADIDGAKARVFKPGVATTTRLLVTAGASCSLDFSAVPTPVTVVTKPRHGALDEPEPKHFVYQSASGFKGKDGLTIKLCFDANASKCSSHVYQFVVR